MNETRPAIRRVTIGGHGVSEVTVGEGAALAVICGPCVIESRELVLRHAERISDICRRAGLDLVFKTSYDKANRTSVSGYRGVGMERGLELLSEVRREFGVPVITDVHSPDEARAAARVVDVLQIPAFLCRQTDLLLAAGRCGKPVMVKKGQFIHPEDMAFAVDKVRSGGSSAVLLCERGSCFGYRELVVDFRALEMMRGFGWPVVFDATHSVQVMGGKGGASGGNRQYVPALARAAVAVGVDAVFLESHLNPDTAPSDGPNMIPVDDLAALLDDLRALAELNLSSRR